MPPLPRHQCIIYQGSPSLHLQSLSRTIIDKLKAKKRCICLNSPTMVAGMRSTLMAEGLDLTAEIAKGALILTSDQSHLVDGKFNIEKMLDMLNTATQQALDDGYVGLWATGDMTWELGNEKNFDKLFDYERRLEELLQHNPSLSGVCQYHRDTIPFHAIATVMQTHPAIYINETLSYLNPDYR